MDRNISIINDLDGRRFVLINDIRFKGKREDWRQIEEYLRQYIGEFYEVEDTAEKIFISFDFPDEYANSESRIMLKGAVAKAKANASQAIPELIELQRHRSILKTQKRNIKKTLNMAGIDIECALPCQYIMIRVVN